MPNYRPVSVLSAGQQVPAVEWLAIVNDLQLHQNVQCLTPVNNTPGAVAAGYVGVMDPTAANSMIQTTTPGDVRKVVVVQDSAVALGAQGYCQFYGRCAAVNVTGAVALYDPLQTSGTAGYAQSGTTNPFGIALSTAAGPGTGTVIALLVPLMGGGAFPTGLPSATHGPLSFHKSTTGATTIITAPGSGKTLFITRVRLQNNNTTAALVTGQDVGGSIHTESWPLGGVVGSGVVDQFDPPWAVGDNKALEVNLSATADVYGSINFYTGSTP